jgi:hypothetical protein
MENAVSDRTTLSLLVLARRFALDVQRRVSAASSAHCGSTTEVRRSQFSGLATRRLAVLLAIH